MPALMIKKRKVAVVYDGFPHYRKGVIEALSTSEQFDYVFFGASQYRDTSIPLHQFQQPQKFVETRNLSAGPFQLQNNLSRHLLWGNFSHCIFLGNAYFLTYWLLTPVLRLKGIRVHFWTHGWISQSESWPKRIVRNTFFRLASSLLLYGRRARDIGEKLGFDPKRMSVIGNSLDYPQQKQTYAIFAKQDQRAIRRDMGFPEQSRLIICTARITHKCRFDLLLLAAHQLDTSGIPVCVVIIGDGPARQALEQLAQTLNIDCRFRGACYEEYELCKLHLAADVTVSPGKVGLTAMHSMAYGTPVISHGNLDRQMPEHEAIIAGVTGDFFTEGSADDLARVLRNWFAMYPMKPERACIECIEKQFTPNRQRDAIERALLESEANS